ncbi:MAG: response regulator [Candidatus Obscuribacterales bacterium]|nr:response regulator [Candidatus Obscuribacterales bacterium]
MNEPILVVDDDDTQRNVTALQAKRLGFIPLMASNGEVALALMSKTKVRLVLMDVQMPILDGLETSRAIRALEHQNKTTRIPIIAMTANPDEEQCYKAGMDDFLFKPVLLNDLKNVLRRWLTPEPEKDLA